MTKYYGIMPWDIGKLTLFQWQVYMEKIEKIYTMFHPEPKKDNKSNKVSSKSYKYDKENHEELKHLAKRKGIKLPKKGL